MSLPSPALSVPTLLNDQISFQGVTLGVPPNNPFGIVKLEGVGKPKVRSGNTVRPRQRGAFIGANLLGTRVITATLDIGPPFGSYGTLAGALRALTMAFSTEGVTEYPLWIQLPNQPLVACLARVLAFDPPYDVTADLGGLMKGVPVQFEATDPYFYAAPTVATSLGLPTPGVGFSFNLSFNLSFGGASGGNQATIVNGGDVPCYPLLVITGPCLNPTVSNQSIPGNPTVSLNVELNAGDVLVVDCDFGSITVLPSGSSVSAPAPQLENAGTTYFGLLPGSNVILFNSQDTSHTAGSLSVWNTAAYDGLTG